MLFACIKYHLIHTRAATKGFLCVNNVFSSHTSHSVRGFLTTRLTGASNARDLLAKSRNQVLTVFRNFSKNVSKKPTADSTSLRRLISLAKPEKIRLLC